MISLDEAYEILGIPSHSTAAQVKTAFKRLALKTHPDKCRSNNDAILDNAEKIKIPENYDAFLRISDAYQRIVDPDYEISRDGNKEDSQGNTRKGMSEEELEEIFSDIFGDLIEVTGMAETMNNIDAAFRSRK